MTTNGLIVVENTRTPDFVRVRVRTPDGRCWMAASSTGDPWSHVPPRDSDDARWTWTVMVHYSSPGGGVRA
jgi:hypothetical protein